MFFLCYLVLLLSLYAQALQAGELPKGELSKEVYHHQEVYQIQKKDSLPALAQKRAIRLQVITKQNNLKNPQALKPGATVFLNYSYILPTGVSDGLVVNLAELAVYHFQNGVFQRRYPLAAGRRDWETPTGNYKILNKIKNPTWRVPESIQEEMYYRGQEILVEVPPGPDNPLGGYWMATSARGVGFHATTAPWSIGRYASHGCLRMLPADIEELFGRVEVGLPVKIIYQPVKLAQTPDNRIFLQIHGDYYRRVPNVFKEVEALIKNNQLEAMVDWTLVKKVVRERDGVAIDITKTPEPTTVQNPLGTQLYSGEIIDKPGEPASAAAPRSNNRKKSPPGS